MNWLFITSLAECSEEQFGMGTAEGRASKKTTHYDRVSYIPGIKVGSFFELVI
jgi:hypothetical protein